MKSEKGVTLISLIIYVIAMLITVTVITIVTAYFSKNIDIQPENYTYFSEFTKIESYFSREANFEKNRILYVSPDTDIEECYIALSSGNQYSFIKENKAIYQNNVKIASGVEECKFSEIIKNGKAGVKIEVKIQGMTRNMEYILKN